MIHFKDKSGLSTRWAQMSKQEQIIEKKKMEIQAKLEAQKQAAALAAQAKLSNQKGAEDSGSNNIFSNDGSFLNQFKSLLEKQKQDKIEKENAEKEKLREVLKPETGNDGFNNPENNEPEEEPVLGRGYCDDSQNDGPSERHSGDRQRLEGSNHIHTQSSMPGAKERNNYLDRNSPSNNNPDAHLNDSNGWDRLDKDQQRPMGPNMPGGPMPPNMPSGLPPNMPGGPMPPYMGGPPNWPPFMGPNGPMPGPPNMGPNGPMPPFFRPPFPMGPNGPMNNSNMPNMPFMGPRPPFGPNFGNGNGHNFNNNSGPNFGNGHNFGNGNGPPNFGNGNGNYNNDNNSFNRNGPNFGNNGGPNYGNNSNYGSDSNFGNNGPNFGNNPNYGDGNGPNFKGNGPNFGNGPPFLPPNMSQSLLTIPPPKPMDAVTIPPPEPIKLQNIPKPEDMDPGNIPAPPNYEVLSTDLDAGARRAAADVARGGDRWERELRQEAGRELWFLHNPESKEYKAFRQLVNKIRRDGPEPAREVKPEDKYEPEFSLEDDDSDGNRPNNDEDDKWKDFKDDGFDSKDDYGDRKDFKDVNNMQRFNDDSYDGKRDYKDDNNMQRFNDDSYDGKRDYNDDNNMQRFNDDSYDGKRDYNDDSYDANRAFFKSESYGGNKHFKDDSYDSNRQHFKEETSKESLPDNFKYNQSFMKREASSQSDEESEVKRERRKRKRSRWGDDGGADVTADVQPGAAPPLPPMPPGAPQLAKIDQEGLKLSTVSRDNQALMQYAIMNFGSTNLSPEDWKKCEDNFKLNLLFQDMLRKRQEAERLAAAGRHKYEYDSDEDTAEGTWEHKLRAHEMSATERWATELTRQAEGKHHIGDFLPPEELNKFMEKYSAMKSGREPDLSDYKEFKLKEDNVGFRMLQKLGWSEGSGLGAEGSGIVDPINKSSQPPTLGLGAATDAAGADDDEFDAYRKRMMLAYRFRPNPLNNPRRPYY